MSQKHSLARWSISPNIPFSEVYSVGPFINLLNHEKNPYFCQLTEVGRHLTGFLTQAVHNETEEVCVELSFHGVVVI